MEPGRRTANLAAHRPGKSRRIEKRLSFSASCTRPTIFADGLRVASPSSFHFEGQPSSVFLARYIFALKSRMSSSMFRPMFKKFTAPFISCPAGLMMNVPRSGKPASSRYTPNIRARLPVGSAPIGYFTSASCFSSRCQARCVNCVSQLTVTTSAPNFTNRSYCSARAANSVAHTKVKSAG